MIAVTKERSSCASSASISSLSQSQEGNSNSQNAKQPVMYTLGQHGKHLHLYSEVFHHKRYWYCDFTPFFVNNHKQQHCLLEGKENRRRHLRGAISSQGRSVSSVGGGSGSNSSSIGIIKEFCQPFTQDALEDLFVGVDTSSVTSMTTNASGTVQEPLPVRTVFIQIRPDCDHCKVFEALNESFATLHPKNHYLLKNSDNCFMAVGADGAKPVVVSGCIVTSKKLDTLERYCLIRFYHLDQVNIDDDEMLQKIHDLPPGKTPLHSNQTPLNNMLGEACAMLQNMYHKRDIVDLLASRVMYEEEDPVLRNKQTQNNTSVATLQKIQQSVLHDIPAPKNSTRETSKFFLDNLQPSPSVLDKMKREIGNGNNENFDGVENRYMGARTAAYHHQVQQLDNRPVFPSLSHKDYDVLQESWPLLERFWSELEMAKCTYNTLVEGETSRFGMRPNQPTLDKDYCIQLFQVSQQRMLSDLKDDIDQAETALHDTLQDYTELEHQLTVVTMMRKYNIPLHDMEGSSSANGATNPFHSKTSDSLDVGQAPISLMKRDPAGFPWEFDEIKLALQDVTHTIACVCLESSFDEIQHSLQVCHRSVSHVFATLERSNDTDQQTFLKRRNRQAMIRLSQQQIYLKDLIRKLGQAPTIWQGLPKLQDAVRRWQEIAEQATNKDDARPQSNWIKSDEKKASKNGGAAAVATVQVPLLEWKNGRYGTACVTQDTIVLLSEVPFLEGSKAYDLNKVEVVIQPKGSMHKVAVMRHGKRLYGMTPTTVDPDSLVKFVRLLKSLRS
mmetsp:Transcript_37147/g.90056  ORF Transcript_37147/g.90056 Transcript_37147/m.90056 type:complete len:784 (+) Transcript_37147:297-2648(+)